VRQRMRVYVAETAPLLDYYRSHGVLREIDGVGKPQEISGRIRSAVGGSR